MHSIVKLLRDKGAPRAEHAIRNDEGFRGELRFSSSGAGPTALLHDGNDEYLHPIIPRLEHAQLVAMQADMMRLRGIERRNGVGYEQEWSVKILSY